MARRKRPVGDPRKLGGGITDVAGDPTAQGGAVIDTRNSVLLDGVEVALVDDVVRPPASSRPTYLAMELRGRVNRSSDRAEVLYLFDEDGAAAIISELIGLATRIGPEFAERLMERTQEVLRASRAADG